jgi:hypothetical protein
MLLVGHRGYVLGMCFGHMVLVRGTYFYQRKGMFLSILILVTDVGEVPDRNFACCI